MGAPKGNKYAAGHHNGNPRSFGTPEDLWNAFIQYRVWVESTPWYKSDILRSGERAGEVVQIPIGRPLLIEGFVSHANISINTFYNYESNEIYKDYFQVSARIRNEIIKNNLEGGYNGSWDSGLVARKLGLADKKEQALTLNTEQVQVSVDGKVLDLTAGCEVRPPKKD